MDRVSGWSRSSPIDMGGRNKIFGKKDMNLRRRNYWGCTIKSKKRNEGENPVLLG